jgi:hypothetical protein
MNDQRLREHLPRAAQRKFDQFVREANASYAAARSVTGEMNDLRADRGHYQTLLRQQRLAGLRAPETTPELEAIEVRLKELSAEHDVLSERSEIVSRPLSACRAWVSNVAASGSKIVVATRPEVEAPKNITDEIAAIRRRIADTDREIREVESAPTPVPELRQRALVALDELASRGMPHVSSRSRGGDPVGWHQHLSLAGLQVNDIGMTRLGNSAIEFLAWVLRDVAAERIGKLFDGMSDEGALDDDTRDERLGQLSAAKLEQERIEEALIVMAQQAGIAIERRENLDARALLGVNDV